MIPRISFVTLGVSDLARAVEFYEQALKLPRLPSVPEIAFFEMGKTWLALFPRAELAHDAGLPAPAPRGPRDFPGFTLSHNVATPAEVDALVADLTARGVTIVKPPGRADWGGYMAYFADPDGFLWEVCYNPHFPHV